MKEILLAVLLGIFGVAVLAAPALAATSVSFTPASVSLRPGQTFSLAIVINPQGAKNYTAKMELNFPADLMEVRSFALANNWLALAQPGYDLTDNVKGMLIKTAGYPGGVSSPITFGTAVLRAKKSGSGTIALSNNSLALDAGNQNVIAGALPRTSVAIAVAPTPTAPITPVAPSAEPAGEIETITGEETPTAPEPTAVSQLVPSRSLLALVGGLATLGTGSAVVGILVGAIILVLASWAIYAAIKKRIRRNNESNLNNPDGPNGSTEPKAPPPPIDPTVP